MQNILGGWRGILDDGVFRVPYPVETRLSSSIWLTSPTPPRWCS
jgi:hypothetical protein